MNEYAGVKFDAGTKRIVNVIRSRHKAAPNTMVWLGATWLLEPSLNFCRQRYGLDWLSPIICPGEGPPGKGFDYYVLLPQHVSALKDLNLRVIYVDRQSQAMLAVPVD